MPASFLPAESGPSCPHFGGSLVRSLGGALPDSSSHFGVLWRPHRSCSLAIPHDFRTPCPSWLARWHELALLTLVSFHCHLRLAEARNLRWADIHCFGAQQQARQPWPFRACGCRLAEDAPAPRPCVAPVPRGGASLAGGPRASHTSRPLANRVDPPAVAAPCALPHDPPTAWCAIAPARAARSPLRGANRALAAATGCHSTQTSRPLDLGAHIGVARARGNILLTRTAII